MDFEDEVLNKRYDYVMCEFDNPPFIANEETLKDYEEMIKRFKIKSHLDYENEINKLYNMRKNNIDDENIKNTLFDVYNEYQYYKVWKVRKLRLEIIDRVNKKYEKIINKEINKNLKLLKKHYEVYEENKNDGYKCDYGLDEYYSEYSSDED